MTEQNNNPETEVVAAVDLGSNSFHMIVCRISNGQLQMVDRMREMVRLAAGLDKNKHLSTEAQARALDCLQRFGQRVSGLPQGAVRAVGTNTLRSARTSGNFLHQAEQALGHPIQIISGVEEARLIYLGVAHSVAADEAPRLVIDIGGGSTELIIGRGFRPVTMESLYMGCVSMSKRFFADGKINPKRLQKALVAAMQELLPVITRFNSDRWELAIGASGTARSIAKVMEANGWCADCISRPGFEQLIVKLGECGHIDKLVLPGLADERRPVFAGGAIILYAAFQALGIKEMRVSDGALREGLIHDLVGRRQHEDVRYSSVKNLAERYHVDTAQAERVAKTAKRCLAMVAQAWQLTGQEAKQWLEWAARLYEIGLDIAHSGYQKHGSYVIANADLAGFSRQEQQLLAVLVRTHRRRLSNKLFRELPEQCSVTAPRLATLLRLAVILHRSRTDQPIPPFQLVASGQSLSVSFPEGWLADNALLQADLKQETDYLEQIGIEFSIR